MHGLWKHDWYNLARLYAGTALSASAAARAAATSLRHARFYDVIIQQKTTMSKNLSLPQGF